MLKMLKVHGCVSSAPIYINVGSIGAVYVDDAGRTVISTTTHNNGGFRVKESLDKVVKCLVENGTVELREV